LLVNCRPQKPHGPQDGPQEIQRTFWDAMRQPKQKPSQNFSGTAQMPDGREEEGVGRRSGPHRLYGLLLIISSIRWRCLWSKVFHVRNSSCVSNRYWLSRMLIWAIPGISVSSASRNRSVAVSMCVVVSGSGSLSKTPCCQAIAYMALRYCSASSM